MRYWIAEDINDVPKEHWKDIFFLPCLVIEKTVKGSMDGETVFHELIPIPKDKLTNMNMLEIWADGYVKGHS